MLWSVRLSLVGQAHRWREEVWVCVVGDWDGLIPVAHFRNASLSCSLVARSRSKQGRPALLVVVGP